MRSITAGILHQLIEEQAELQLVDVREEYEYNEFNIGGTLLPLDTVVQNINLIDTIKPVVFYCRKGVRSQIAIQRLEQKYPFDNLFNLDGGLEAWKKEIEL